MLIASIVLVCLLAIFILVTYLITIKSYTFEMEEGKLQLKNKGSRLKILVDDKVVVSQVMPQLIHGETYVVQMKDTTYTIKCKCNNFGNKMRVEVYKGEVLIKDNGVILPLKKQKES